MNRAERIRGTITVLLVDVVVVLYPKRQWRPSMCEAATDLEVLELGVREQTAPRTDDATVLGIEATKLPDHRQFGTRASFMIPYAPA